MKPKVYFYCRHAAHFLRWERPHWARYVDIVDQPATNAHVIAFGPDAAEWGLMVPGRKRVLHTFPGFGYNPYHNERHRLVARHLCELYDVVFVNPGPVDVALGDLPNVAQYPFSIDDKIVGKGRVRQHLGSLLHVSADYPQKDWTRSWEVMRKSGLPHEVYPPRAASDPARHRAMRLQAKLRRGLNRLRLVPAGLGGLYVSHEAVVKRYYAHDGFVHVAADVRAEHYIDGRYTASLLEAGATGAILFWHDTYGVGGDLETVVEVPIEPEAAASEIRRFARERDVAIHSQRTREEILSRHAPAESVRLRWETLRNVL